MLNQFHGLYRDFWVSMTTIKVIGDNGYKEFGKDTDSEYKLVDAKINDISTKIKYIACGHGFSIYCQEDYQNIYSTGYNEYGILFYFLLLHIHYDGWSLFIWTQVNVLRVILSIQRQYNLMGSIHLISLKIMESKSNKYVSIHYHRLYFGSLNLTKFMLMDVVLTINWEVI